MDGKDTLSERLTASEHTPRAVVPVSVVGGTCTMSSLWFAGLLLLLLFVVVVPKSDARYVQPENCTWEPMPDSTAGVSMSCSLDALEAEPEPTNFSLIMPGHTVRLSIHCGDSTPTAMGSALANGSFQHLRGLRSLTIERCKVTRLPSLAFQGLWDLTHLSVRTYTSEWTHTPLRIEPEAFAPLERIESLDLSENGLESLPHALTCGLAQVRFVNLTKNRFADVVSMGFSSESRCEPTVEQIELTYNRLRVLADKGFVSLARLRELRLDHNQIARAEPAALSGLTKLERLDIAHNMLVALPAALFQATPRLSELYLRNNSLSALPPDLFSGLAELTALDLAHNQLSVLPWVGGPDSAANLSRLSVLDLSYNRLTRLDASSFRSFVALQTLELQNNLIEHIAYGTFAALDALQSLVLSNNRLQVLKSSMMAGLGNSMMTLMLDHNRLSGIDFEAFANLSVLQELSLAGNQLTAVPDAVSSLSTLRSLDLSFNGIDDISNSSYKGLRKLYALNLMGNNVGNISQGAFRNLPSVRVLNLAQNNIQGVEEGTFDELSGLHYLRLDSNVIDDVNGLFGNLHDLIMLNISLNRVRWFDYALIPAGLQWLDVHDNLIEALGNYFELDQSLKLRTLDASSNRLTDLESSSLPNGIEIAYLHNNNLRRIQPFTFLGKQNLTRVDLSNNQLRTIEMAAFRLSEVPLRRPLPEFTIAANPYLCDCHMEWLPRLAAAANDMGDASRHYPRIVDLQSIECGLNFSRTVRTLPLIKVKPSEFLCEYSNHCFSQCHCCDFATCNCEMVCPDSCNCYHDDTWNTNIVDCGARIQYDTPNHLPLDATGVYLDGNNLPTLTASMFVGLVRVRVLLLNNSNVVTIQEHTFAGLEQLNVLRLEKNRISTLRGHEFYGLANLKELYLSDNQLSYIGNTTFARLQSLEILHLNHNRLTQLSVGSFQRNPRLTEVRLAGSPWSCDCRFTKELAQFLHVRGDVVRDIFRLSCVYNETTVLPLWELNVTMDDCYGLAGAPGPVSRIEFRRPIEDFVPVIAVTGALLVLLALTVLLLLVCYRRQLNVWLFSRYGVRMFHHRAPVEEEKLFDAFVSFSKKDEAFVAQILAPELECGSPPYRLCLHYRDLPMAGTYLSEAIQEAVESSRRTIVVLSEHFLKSEWCRFEFKSAHQEVLQNRSHKLVVIFLGRVSYGELDPDIRVWLKHATFLHWGEKRFWDKLRYAMPEARHRNKVMRSDLTSVAVHI